MSAVCPVQFQTLLEPENDEYYISHFDHDGEIVVVSNVTLSICDVNNKLKWSKPWLEIYSVEANGDTQLNIYFMIAKAGSKAPLMDRTFSFPAQTKRDLWLIVFRRLVREAWQEYYESIYFIFQASKN